MEGVSSTIVIFVLSHLLTLSSAQESNVSSTVHTLADCGLAKDAAGACTTLIQRHFYNATTRECQAFSGCAAKGNNFATKEECDGICGPDANTDKEGEILLILNRKDNVKKDLADFEGGSFGNWTANDYMEIIQEQVFNKDSKIKDSKGGDGGKVNAESRQGQAVDNATLSNATVAPTTPTSNTTTPGPTTVSTTAAAVVTTPIKPETNVTTETKVAVPSSSTNDGTLSRDITLQEDYHIELEFSLRIFGYMASSRDIAGQNPAFTLELINAASKEKVVLMDIKNYGKVFERNTDWIKINYVFNYDKTLYGNYSLTLTARRGATAGSNVFVDNLLLVRTTRLTPLTAMKMDAAFETSTTPSPFTGSTTAAPVVVPEAGGSSAAHTASIVLACLVAALVIALGVVSFKYWHLKREMVGTYSVSRTTTSSSGNPAYDNPAFHGGQQHHSAAAAADRYGTIHE